MTVWMVWVEISLGRCSETFGKWMEYIMYGCAVLGAGPTHGGVRLPHTAMQTEQPYGTVRYLFQGDLHQAFVL